MPHCDIDGVSLHYTRQGSGEPLILSFCLGGNLTMWGDEIADLSKHYDVVLFDPRGHGGSDSPTDSGAYGVNRSADDLLALMDHLSIDRAVVGGVSMGAGIAACFAGKYPKRARALLVIDSNTAAGLPVPDKVVQTRNNTIALCEEGDMDAVADYFLETSPSYRLFKSKSETNEARLRDMIRNMNPVGFANTLRSMLAAETVTADLKKISCPTLVMAGEKDPAIKAVELTAATIDHCSFTTLPDAGHLSNLDQPQLFAQAVHQFIASV